MKSGLCDTFLPSLPSNRSKNANYRLAMLSESKYLLCTFLDNLQYLMTSIRSVLATQRVLEGVGGGRLEATNITATLNLLVKDVCGMLSKILFASTKLHWAWMGGIWDCMGARNRNSC